MLSTSLQQMYTDLGERVELLQAAKQRITDIEAKEFEEDFFKFRSHVREMERRVAYVLDLLTPLLWSA